jgi:hypothetical protein
MPVSQAWKEVNRIRRIACVFSQLWRECHWHHLTGHFEKLSAQCSLNPLIKPMALV